MKEVRSCVLTQKESGSEELHGGFHAVRQLLLIAFEMQPNLLPTHHLSGRIKQLRGHFSL